MFGNLTQRNLPEVVNWVCVGLVGSCCTAPDACLGQWNFNHGLHRIGMVLRWRACSPHIDFLLAYNDPFPCEWKRRPWRVAWDRQCSSLQRRNLFCGMSKQVELNNKIILEILHYIYMFFRLPGILETKNCTIIN